MKPKLFSSRVTVAVLLVLAAAGFALHLHTPVFARLHVIGLHTGPRIMALTYDDGPDPANTPKILDMLDQYNAKATFFLIGVRAQQHPGLAREIANRGHAVGNHTWSHPRDVRLLSDKDFALELSRGAGAVSQAAGQPVSLFRPPRGCVDARILSMASSRDFQTVMWNIAPAQKRIGPPERMAAHVRRYAFPGAVILLHDGVGPLRTRDVRATHLILRDMSRRGYRFVTLPELLDHYPRAAR